MKLLHTSDWHLGQTLHEHERIYEHQCFLDWLLATLATEQPDLLLIAGDVFDSINPPVSAQRQLYAFVADAVRQQPTLQIVMIAGNHDSGARIELPAPLMAHFGVSVIGRVTRTGGQLDLDRLCIPVRVNGSVVAQVLALPFLRPAEVTAADQSFLDGIARTHGALFDAAIAARVPGQALIAVAHAHLQDGAVSPGSERRIVIGNAEALPASLFPDALAYVALGHLHLAQWVAGQPRIRYCGSPLPLSFAERDYAHQVLLASFEGEQLTAVRELPIPRAVPMLQISGALAPVLDALARLEVEPLPRERQPWVEVRVQLEGPVLDLAQQVDSALAGRQVRLLGPIAEYPRTDAAGEAGAPSAAPLDPIGLFAQVWERRWGEPPGSDVLNDFAQLAIEAEDDGVR